MSKIEVNTVAPQCGTTLTLGESGDTVTLGSGASQSGFGRTGTVDWDTTPKTSAFTAVSGNGYFVDTTSSTLTVTLPASPSANDIVAIADYAGTASTNNITIARNGSNFEGGTEGGVIATNRQTATLIFVDSTQGWIVVNSNDASFIAPTFIAATGGTETTCGDFKIHTFTGPGTFCVSSIGNPVGSNSVEYIVVAGGGGGGRFFGAGAGAGGFRFASSSLSPLSYPGKPLAAPANLPVSVQGYPITVGAGGNASSPPGCGENGTNGANSVFSTITSAGGGKGGSNGTGVRDGVPGGSGGGAKNNSQSAGAGNTPPVSPAQGQDGGAGGSPCKGGGGGGAIAVGGPGAPGTAGPGGAGAGIPTAFGSNGVPSGGFRYYAGGGGGGGNGDSSTPTGGLGGGGQGADATNGTANTGGGGGGAGDPGGNPPGTGGSGGSGIVIIRYKFQ